MERMTPREATVRRIAALSGDQARVALVTLIDFGMAPAGRVLGKALKVAEAPGPLRHSYGVEVARLRKR